MLFKHSLRTQASLRRPLSAGVLAGAALLLMGTLTATAQQNVGELFASDASVKGGVVLASSTAPGKFAPGVRIFHIKFGPGMVAAVDGAKLTIDFDKAGRKLVLESFVERRD